MEREKELTRVTLVGSVGNLLLLTFKFVAGIVGHSAAMVADAAHSLSDFVTDIVVLVFIRIGSRPQDASHDYGHGKFETLATLFVALGLVAAALSIIISGVLQFIHWIQGETLPMPGMLALWAALLSIVIKEILFRYTLKVGKKNNSPAVIANAWHHRSDALSSIGAAIGIGGALLLGKKWAVLDPLASILVGLMLLRVSWDLLKTSINELTDSSLPEEVEKEIEEIICRQEQAHEPHNLRTRRIGNRIAIEAHVRLDGNMPLQEAHEIVSRMEQELRARFGAKTLITIHMEPRK